jgi:hypothetical protein
VKCPYGEARCQCPRCEWTKTDGAGECLCVNAGNPGISCSVTCEDGCFVVPIEFCRAFKPCEEVKP